MLPLALDTSTYERLAGEIADPAAAMASSRPMLDTQAVTARLEAAIRAARPFSMLRVNDGEGYYMGWPDITPRQNLVRSLQNHLGRSDLSETELDGICEGIRQAVANADIVGVYAKAEINAFSIPRLVIERRGLAGPRTEFCRASIHRNLQEEGCFDRLLGGLDWLGLVSTHDLSRELERRFGVGRVEWFPVPGQARTSEEGNAADTGHFPGRFEALRRELQPPKPGAVFLLGAGFLGKIYARWIKDRDGIAIDIGSTLDGWAGKPTRRYLRPGKASSSETVLDRYRL
ncbi:MAG TPA: hypothetical protein VF559_11400 [Caulobacteraceae bacterium]